MPSYVIPSYVILTKTMLVSAYLFQIFLVHDQTKPTRVVIDIQWLTYHIIGPTLAGEKFAGYLNMLPSKPSYKRHELEAFYNDVADFPTLSQLLQSLDLMVTFDDTEFFIPCKVLQSTKMAEFKNGKSIFCVDGNSMLSPTVFHVVQARIMKAIGSQENQPILSKGSMQFLHRVIGLAKEKEEGDRDAINFAVVYKHEDPEACFHDLEKITTIVVTTMYELSPGTSIATGTCLK